MWVIILFKRFLYFLTVFILLFPVKVNALNAENISAECYVVIDYVTNRVLFEKNSDLRHSMASTTKIMTCLLACESKRLDDVVTVSGEMLKNADGTSLYLKAGDKLLLRDLVKGAMLESGNDAANAIAFFLDGSVDAFCKRMNKKAKIIGMDNTNFETPSGLDSDKHYSTAYDMALLASYAFKNKSLADIASRKTDTISVNGISKTLYNHNKLLSKSKHFVGFKTGYTKKSGRCLVSGYNYSASKIIIVTLNAPDDWNDHLKLVKASKKKYNSSTNTVFVDVNAVGSSNEKLKCSFVYNVKHIGKLDYRLYYYPFIYAPVKAGNVIGKAELYIDNNYVKTVYITADEDLNYGG